MSIDQAIRIFATFLNCSIEKIKDLINNRNYTSDENSLNDWIQVNWEILVERKVLNLNEYIEVYGEGADFTGGSSRVSNSDALPNYKVIVNSKNGEFIFDVLNRENFCLRAGAFDKVVGFKNGFYSLEYDFDYVLLNDEQNVQRVFAINDVEFLLESI